MKIEIQPDPDDLSGEKKRTKYSFPDGKFISISVGGENIVPNTYGFEIEFCSHDSSVFMFTHVDVLSIAISSLNKKMEWKIETDSGGVLELVTSPLWFNSTNEAYSFKKKLAYNLVQSIYASAIYGEHRDMGSVLLRDLINKDNEFGIHTCISLSLSDPISNFEIDIATWEHVGSQLTVKNIDDGINIAAARMRHEINRDSEINQHKWKEYVGSTVISRSQKDWSKGYSSQVNLPMTLAGYYLLSMEKFDKSQKRKNDILTKEFPENLTDLTLRKNIETWFWRSIIWEISQGYAEKFFLKFYNVSNFSISIKYYSSPLELFHVKLLGLIYIMVSKILTGALGALSEPVQLLLQELAWKETSMEFTNTDSPLEYRALIDKVGGLNIEWREFHSSMKDLTGLWFKASFFDVIFAEAMPKKVLTALSQILKETEIKFWLDVMDKYYFIIKSETWNKKIEKKRENYVDDLELLDWNLLIREINRVSMSLQDALLIDREAQKELYTMNEDPSKRPFLGYLQGLPWEGRYDTMYKPIFREGLPATYLIEHRFN
jgi:hypothetical protein